MNDLQQKQAAIDCAKRALKACIDAERHVKDACYSGLGDMFLGKTSLLGSFIQMIKHMKLAAADRALSRMRRELEHFRSQYFALDPKVASSFNFTELLADLFLDNIFVDAFLQVKLTKILHKIQDTKEFLVILIENMETY